jgi:uncharacterized protein (DUF2062 family)
MDIDFIEDQDFSFGKEVAKAFVISTAATAGTFAGILAVGYAYGKIQDFREARRTKKNPAN